MKVYPRQFPMKINSKWYDGSRKWNENFQFEYSSDIRHLLHSWIFTIFLYYSYFLCRQFVMLLQLRVQIKAESERNTWSMNGSCVKMKMTHLLWKVSYFCVYVIDSANEVTQAKYMCEIKAEKNVGWSRLKMIVATWTERGKFATAFRNLFSAAV